jgi:serine/threonine protein kinase
MKYLHSLNVIHRDLKGENVFLNEALEPFVADFGTARHVDGGLEMTMGAIGTPYYMAPELAQRTHPTYAGEVDVYSFAVMLYACFATRFRLDDRPPNSPQPTRFEDYIRRVAAGARFIRPPEMPDFYWGLITNCWQAGWESRPTFAEIVAQFKETHGYVFPDADLQKVMAYEEKVDPTPKPVDPFQEELDRFLDGEDKPSPKSKPTFASTRHRKS